MALSATGTATSASFSGTKASGTYNWVAAYSGDANSAPSTSKCGAEPVHLTASGVQGITTPGTGLAGSVTQIGLGIELLLGGLALFLGSELIKGTKQGLTSVASLCRFRFRDGGNRYRGLFSTPAPIGIGAGVVSPRRL